MINFIKHHIIHRFGVPRRIIHDNGPQFASKVFYQFYNKYQIQNVASTTYNTAANGLAEAFNKTIIKLLKKFISSSKRGEARWMSLGLPNHGSDPDRQYSFFPGIRMRSSHTIRNPDAVITSRFND